jgi:hypothetical protein
MEKEPNESLGMESNCRTQYGSFQLKLLKIWANFNSFQAVAPLTGQKKRGTFLREHISLKNGTFCPLFSHDTTFFKRKCFLIKQK